VSLRLGPPIGKSNLEAAVLGNGLVFDYANAFGQPAG